MAEERWNTRIVPHSSHARLLAAKTIASMEHWGDVSSEQLAVELEVFFEAGWCVDALIRGFTTRPDGTPQAQVNTGRRTDLVRYLLNQWRDDGTPLAPPIEASEGTNAVVSASAEEQRAQDRVRAHKGRAWPRSVAPETYDQVTAAIQRIRSEMRWRADQLSDAHLRQLVAPFFAHGWSVDCLVHAFKHNGATREPDQLETSPKKSLADTVAARLDTWIYRRNKLPKRPPRTVLTYDEWDKRQAELGTYDIRERRRTQSEVQLEALQQAREFDSRRRQQRAQERIAETRHGTKADRSIEALYEIGPPVERPRVVDAPNAANGAATRHERLVEGVGYLSATDPVLIRWLRILAQMDPKEIGPEAAKVTRLRLRDSRTAAALAALDQYGDAGRELGDLAQTLAQYVVAGPDIEASDEVSDLWRVLRGAIRGHDRRNTR